MRALRQVGMVAAGLMIVVGLYLAGVGLLNDTTVCLNEVAQVGCTTVDDSEQIVIGVVVLVAGALLMWRAVASWSAADNT